MVLSDSIWQDFYDTGRSIGSYIVFSQGGPIDHCDHGSGPVAKYSAGGDYNAACTTVMGPSHFRMINNDIMNKDPDMVP